MSSMTLLLRRSLLPMGYRIPPPPVFRRKSQIVAPLVVLSSLMLLDQRFGSTNKASTEGRRTNHTGSSNTSGSSPDKESESSSSSFDISKQWQEAKKDGTEYLRQFLNVAADHSEDDKTSSSTGQGAASTTQPKAKDASATTTNSIKDRVWSKISEVVTDATNNNKDDDDSNKGLEFQEMTSTVMNLIKGRVGGGESKGTLEDIVDKARSLSEQGGISDKTSLTEVLDVTQKAAKALDATMVEFLGGTTKSLPLPYPTNLFYFLEREDEKKNPSWRRRVHRFCTGIDVSTMDELHTKLELAALAYSDSLVEIRYKLALPSLQYDLLYCAMDSYPGKPSHFVAVKKTDQSQSKGGFWKSDDPLEVILVVRGTKTISDVITDLLSHPEEYRGGKAHSGILQSGLYLANRHDDLLQELSKLSGSRRKIKLTLIGHSLGAGAASIAGMEIHNRDDLGDNLDVQVFGFGCPALLSKDLSEQAKSYITTIVADNDCIPRMSTATMLNAILDIGEYNWIPSARRDIEDLVHNVATCFPYLFTATIRQRILSTLDDILADATTLIPPASTKRMTPELFPPGTCVHFYRDGFGITGNVVPCTFFHELDVSRRMVDDHLFQTGYKLIFLDLMRQQHNDNFFQFEIDKER